MQELLDELLTLRSDCGAHANRLYQNFPITPGDGPIGGLGICYNAVTIAAELTSYYAEVWNKRAPQPGQDLLKARRENGERLAVLGNLLFTKTMSGCEFQAKEGVRSLPAILELTKKRPTSATLCTGPPSVASSRQMSKCSGMAPLRFEIAWCTTMALPMNMLSGHLRLT